MSMTRPPQPPHNTAESKAATHQGGNGSKSHSLSLEDRPRRANQLHQWLHGSRPI